MRQYRRANGGQHNYAYPINTMIVPEYILTLSCPDQRGIVHRVSGFLTGHGCNILDSAQFGETQPGKNAHGEPKPKMFFMRVRFALDDKTVTDASLRADLAELVHVMQLQANLHDVRHKPRLLLMVSKIGHCLNDLLYRYRSGLLPVEIPAIVSNHQDFYQLAASHNIPFYHLPLAAGAPEAEKLAQEAKILELIKDQGIELVVLARYMQVLSSSMCKALEGRAINIHHSFLPSFKGAKPYTQAWERGVKLIGATAHFVTSALDEGPIIEQDVERVDHATGPESLVAIGADIESMVLARAVKWYVERRILLNGHKTIVFR